MSLYKNFQRKNIQIQANVTFKYLLVSSVKNISNSTINMNNKNAISNLLGNSCKSKFQYVSLLLKQLLINKTRSTFFNSSLSFKKLTPNNSNNLNLKISNKSNQNFIKNRLTYNNNNNNKINMFIFNMLSIYRSSLLSLNQSILMKKHSLILKMNKLKNINNSYSANFKKWYNLISKKLKLRLNMITNNGKKSVYFASLSSISMFTWDDYKINDKDVKSEVADILSFFKDNDNNNNDNNIDKINQVFCMEKMRKKEDDEWKIIYDKPDIIIWRRNISLTEVGENLEQTIEDGNAKVDFDLFEYKVLGKIDDINAIEFFQTQIDLKYRQEWDYLAVYLDIIDKEKDTNTELIRWIMKFPYPLNPREYIYVRRYCVDLNHKLLLLVSRSLPNISLPDFSYKHAKQSSSNQHQNYVRVTQYKSNIVIMPKEDFDKPGLFYVIQYYDVNKAKIPKIAYKWMAASGLPDYINKVHKATIKLNHRHKTENKHKEVTKAHVLTLNEILTKYDVIDLNEYQELVSNNQEFNLNEEKSASLNNEISENSNEFKSDIDIDLNANKINNENCDIVDNNSKNKINDKNFNDKTKNAQTKKYFRSVLEEINEEFLNANEPHPLFYN